MVKEAAGYRYSLNVDRVKGISFSAQFPDEEVLRSFLLTFRQFMAPKEPVFINRIYGISLKRLEPTNKLRDQLIEARKAWLKALKNNGIGLVFNEQELSPEYVAKLWLNGYYFHNDDDKYVTLERMLGHELAFVKAHFMEFLIQATGIIIYTGNVVAYALKNNHFRF